MVETPEIAELRAQLAEAETALDAIRSGAVDAFVGEGGDVFRLNGSERPYVTFFAAMNEGGVTLDSAGAILHGNPRFTAMIGRPIAALRGAPFLSCVTPADRPRAAALLASAVTAACEVCLCNDGVPLPVRLSMTTVRGDRQRFRCLVVTDLRERVAAEAAIRDSGERLRAMYANLNTIIEAERKRVAREVHDELGQVLTALRMETSLLLGELKGQGTPAQRVAEMLLLIEDMFHSVRSIALDLRPATLDLGLGAAIEWLAGDFERRWQIQCTFDIDPADIEASEAYATTVFRIIQESLNNVARHARASRVSISLRQHDERMQLEVHDDGCGFAGDPAQMRGFGMIGMHERVQELGGHLSIRAAPGQGTHIVIDLPLAQEAA